MTMKLISKIEFLYLLLFFNTIFPSISLPFMSTRNITVHGDARLRNNAITLTQEHSCPSSYSSASSIGRAFYLYPIRFLDPTTNTTKSFSCRFSFSIIASPLCPFGDGLAFLITSNVEAFSRSYGYIGLPGPMLSNRDRFVAFEFDTNSDSALSDLGGDHIGLDLDTVVSFASVNVESRGIDLKSGREISVWIEYTDLAKLVQVWIGYLQVKPPNPILAATVDLSQHLKEYMYVGFTASNGHGSAIHAIHHWRFRTYDSLSSLSSVDLNGESDCFLCYPLDSRGARKKGRDKEDLALGLGGLAAFLLTLIAIIASAAFCLIRRKKSTATASGEEQNCRVNKVPTMLSISEIKTATLGFNRNRIVGRGASATVYKGSLPSGRTVAVKRFDRAEIDCTRNPFVTEFATIVGCLRHKNLVQLQGWCSDGAELVLVYEYLPNGSLDKVLHKDTRSTIFLSFKQRLNIILGVASALTYLHEECERQIIHRDVKSCNIMLDAEFNAKLGDFGLAEVYEHSSITREVTIPAGTMGYLAPEYVYYGIPSEKTDVYSFGVVILEVATRRRPLQDNGVVLVDWVWKLFEQSRLLEAADKMLSGKFLREEMERMLKVGLWCVLPNHEKRPTVKEAARVLRGEAAIPVLPIRKPKVGFRVELDSRNFEDHSPEDLPWMTPKSHFG